MTNKLRYFIANWKMYGDLSSFKVLKNINFFLKNNKKRYHPKVIACVPTPLINSFSLKLKNSSIAIGAQNCHAYDGHGPYTGSISSLMLKKLGSKYIILGHSDNRREGETNKLLKKKLELSLSQKLKVIFCIGETLNEKNKKKTFIVLKKQLESVLSKKLNFDNIIFAYEPVWSIGTGKIPKTNELKKVIIFIKKFLRKKFRNADYSKVVYGGSVNSSNIYAFSSIDDIDGFLIGSASLSSKKFIDIIRKYYR